ncbi:MAG: 1-deoxy-D-xylulose-5-phosphate reductoisomerase [Planctomycetes bacterium]|nr:1-deoxy-D-xylulose-5-phosphate reductoisomerase [Planctomycetota bacterium]
MKRIAILGSTGSVGRSVIEVIKRLGSDYRAVAVSANSQWKMLADQARELGVDRVAIANQEHLPKLREALSDMDIDVGGGAEALCEIASGEEVDLIVASVVGAAGLAPVLAGIEHGKTIAIANKEPLVMAGELIMAKAKENNVSLLPVDSEHSAVFQAMQSGRRSEVSEVVITASGGPFYALPLSELKDVTAERALDHPTWNMGEKVTVDSACLVNKALEVVEARWLFDLDPAQIRVLIHPQSIVHSLVKFCDGSVLAQMALPDMKLPIQYALTYPERRNGLTPDLDLSAIGQLTFAEPDTGRFPALRLGYRAAEVGGSMGAVLSAADEVAVEAFLQGRLKFLQMVELIEDVMNAHSVVHSPSLDQILAADGEAREEARRWVSRAH